MQTARYHRDQADLCLEMARHMSDPHAAELLRAAAARHFVQALDEPERSSNETPGAIVGPTDRVDHGVE